jgi:hypothetical protein
LPLAPCALRCIWRGSACRQCDLWRRDRRGHCGCSAQSAAGAGQPFGRGGGAFQPVFFNVVTAINAIAKFAAVDPRQRRQKTLAVLVTQALGGFGHGLILQRVHTREPAHRLLIQGDHLLCAPAPGIAPVQLCQRASQQFAKMFKLGDIHM